MTKDREGAAAHSPEDKFRMNAAEHLDAMLSRAPRMFDLCGELVDAKDRALVISAAARLMQAGAVAALAQLRVALSETRHRVITEKSAELNRKIYRHPNEPKPGSDAVEVLIQKINRIAEARGNNT